ncbi:MAG: MFS transporter [Methylocella sp.]
MPSRFLLPVLALAVYFVGATEFMLSAMLTPLADAFETTPAQASWLVSSYALSYAVAAPLFGHLSDRIDRRRLLLASLMLFALDGTALTLAPSFSFAIGLRVFGGLASAALIPTAFALISDLMPGERQAGAMGFVMLGMTLGIAAGPVFAGFLTEELTWRAPFILTAAGCLITFALGRFAIPRSSAHGHRRDGASFAWLKKRRIVRPLVGKGAWNGTAVAAFLLSGEVLRRRYGFGAAEIGASVSVFGIGLGIGNLAVGRIGRICGRDEVTLMLATLVVAIALTAFMIAPLPFLGSVLSLGIWGAALGLAAPSSAAILAMRAGEDKGMVLATSESLNNLTILVILPIAAVLLASHGIEAAMLVLGTSILIGVGLTVIDLRAAMS